MIKKQDKRSKIVMTMKTDSEETLEEPKKTSPELVKTLVSSFQNNSTTLSSSLISLKPKPMTSLICSIAQKARPLQLVQLMDYWERSTAVLRHLVLPNLKASSEEE